MVIKTEFRRVALCHPEVAMELMSGGAAIYSLPQATLLERIIDIIGFSAKKNMLEVGVDTSIAKVTGYVCRASAAKVRPDQYMFVNGRYFKSPYLAKAVTKAYEHLIPNGSQPSFFIYLTVDPDRVDVNVHAQKIEVRFADTDAIWQIINAAVRETLAKTGSVPMMDFETANLVDIPVATTGVTYQMPKETTCDNYNPFASESDLQTIPSKGAFYDISNQFSNSSAIEDFNIPSTPAASQFEFIDIASEEQYLELESTIDTKPTAIHYIGRRYASMIAGGALAIVDLTRARERILFERYHAMLSGANSVSQQLLFPERLTLSDGEYSLMEEWAVDFAALGFDIDMHGSGEIEVKGIPADLSADSLDKAIYELLQSLALPHQLESMRREHIALTLAQSQAAKKVQYTQSDAQTIVEQLMECSNTNHTHLGKSIMTFITLDDIQQKLS